MAALSAILLVAALAGATAGEGLYPRTTTSVRSASRTLYACSGKWGTPSPEMLLLTLRLKQRHWPLCAVLSKVAGRLARSYSWSTTRHGLTRTCHWPSPATSSPVGLASSTRARLAALPDAHTDGTRQALRVKVGWVVTTPA